MIFYSINTTESKQPSSETHNRKKNFFSHPQKQPPRVDASLSSTTEIKTNLLRPPSGLPARLTLSHSYFTFIFARSSRRRKHFQIYAMFIVYKKKWKRGGMGDGRACEWEFCSRKKIHTSFSFDMVRCDGEHLLTALCSLCCWCFFA